LQTLTARDGMRKAPHPSQRRSLWVSADAKTGKLLYVSDWYANVIDIFGLPSDKQLGELPNFFQPQGLCTDGSHVWIPNTETSQILEYRADSPKKIATLEDPGQFPAGCSYDPITGNLAVSNIAGTSQGEGNVAIYAKASGSPRTYTCSSLFKYYFVGYDDRGNLYADGEVSLASGGFAFCGLRKGASSMRNISLNQSIDYPGQVQWDGKYVTVSDQNDATVYRFTIKGTSGTEEGSTVLDGADDCVQNWIEENKVYCPAFSSAAVFIYPYPAGGAPINKITGFSEPVGATVVEYIKRKR
jgi:hypothetical protein